MSDFGGLLDELFAPGATIGVKEADYSLTQSEYKDGDAFNVVGNTRAGAKITLPAIRQRTAWRTDPAGTQPVNVYCGGDPVELQPGDCKMIVTDKNGRISAVDIVASSGSSSAWTEIDSTDSPYQATSGQHLDVDTTAATVTVTLPASPSKYDEVWFRNSAQSFATHALTIARNGSTIMAQAEDMTVSTDGADLSLWFNGTTWQLPGAQL